MLEPTPLAQEAPSLEISAVLLPHRRRWARWLAAGWLLLIVLACVASPVLPLADYDEPDFEARRAAILGDAGYGPSLDHPLGIDDRGRDVLSRILSGGLRSLALGFLTIGGAILIGGTLGVIGGYFQGRIDRLVTGALDVMLAFPQLVLAIALVAFLGQGFWNVCLALVIVATPLLGRISRASALTYSQREFVLAAKAIGAKHRRIVVREVLPNVLPAMFSIALLGIAVVIVAEGGLAILGVGLPGPAPSWGRVVNEGFGGVRENPWPLLVAATVIFLTVLALNYLGDVVREHFDVRESAL